MLETASHILSIVSGEGSEQIRIWLENPERNGDNLDRLAGKLASFPRAPYGRAYWRLVLRSSRDRPFTLLRESLALRKAFQLSGADPGPGSTAPAPGPAPGSKPAGGEETTKEASSEAGSSPEATSTEAGAASEAGGGRRGRGLSGTSTSPWS
ncbi:uncharacterized protein LOC127748932 [Frankliniella occidentalis]|uniref:Uncharacterized protein LOC127748932 n=1 Tax=Frankliniella occidentalis TaxID=133901 RepID=A0A9C6WLR8_FRAOC|nr:uncharacterized protein LOC127748932 [Frankliniella occidentalis]